MDIQDVSRHTKVSIIHLIPSLRNPLSIRGSFFSQHAMIPYLLSLTVKQPFLLPHTLVYSIGKLSPQSFKVLFAFFFYHALFLKPVSLLLLSYNKFLSFFWPPAVKIVRKHIPKNNWRHININTCSKHSSKDM